MKKFLTIVCCFNIVLSYGQTIFTSQGFVNLPQINPAMAGMGNNNKVDFYYRSQFLGLGDPFTNFGIGFNIGVKKKDPSRLNKLGVAGFIESENMMNGAFQKNSININIANRIFLNPEGGKYISFGLGTSFTNRYLDITKLSFEDQFNSGRLFSNLSLESYQKYPSYITSNIGSSFVNNDEKTFFQMGAGLYYIYRLPSEALITNEFINAHLFNAMINFEFELPSSNSLLLHLGYEQRIEKKYFDASVAIGLPFWYKYETPQNKLYLGLNYRVKDALVPFVQILFNQYKFGLSYDFYQNDLTLANIHTKTFEVSITQSLRKRRSHYFQGLFNY